MSQTSLYKRAKAGKIQKWTIELEGNKFRTIEGFVDGAQTPTEWTICQGKRIGASNETTPDQQAAKEVESKITKQKDKGYTEDAANVDAAAKKISPMLAHKWEDHKEKITEAKKASQPKLDGVRCVATLDGLFTRNGKPILTAPHIHEQAVRLINMIGLPNVKLDGELYNHELKNDFNKIISLVKKQKPTAEDLEESKKILQYHIYDLDVLNLDFMTRFAILKVNHKQLGPKAYALQVVHTVFMTDQEIGEEKIPEIDFLFGKYIEMGFEGQMIRISGSQYENSRSKSLLKRKEFEEAEFKIVDIEEGVGNRSGMMGRVKFEKFDSNARGSHEYFKELLANKDKYIGSIATVRYQNLTPDGVPRFPVMIAIRDYE